MAGTGRIERRLAAAIVLTALIPLLAAVFFARNAVQQTSSRFFIPEIRAHLDEAVGLYQDLARSEKDAMRAEATVFALTPGLAEAVQRKDRDGARMLLYMLFAQRKDLVSLTVVSGDDVFAKADRGRPVDEARELTLEVRKPLGRANPDDDDAPALVAVFAAPRARFEEAPARMSQFVDTYGKLVARREADERTYLLVFAVLVGTTIAVAIGVGTLLARSVSTRIVRLADATRKVGAGDLTTRVDESGSDEVGDLARAFNRMLAEVETTRARIEYLQRIGAWQEMARRLAHEIKNPLTPIQLAVEEIHQRYDGSSPPFKKLLDATLEVVQAEVSTLRRLVGEFSDFARLPQAHLEPGDLVRFLADHSDESSLTGETTEERPGARVTVKFEIPFSEAPAAIDKQMLRRALINLIRNSAQALRDAGKAEGNVVVTLGRSGDFWLVDVDDDGPGIPEDQRDRIFDPYVTTKSDGTGLGLAIVKKIVVEHGGAISAQKSPLGGARLRVTIPVAGSAVALAMLDKDPMSGKSRSSPNSAPPSAAEPAS
ncbi:MAG TPA: ATP-binding protein [Polyangiaceae bacterium]|nr:ATP-binding protein [Polyangiaceae bacterium]